MRNDMEEYDDARQAYEHLLMTLHENEDDKPKTLTASSKRVKEMELQLLDHLEHTDESIDPLVDLWTLEREDAAPILRRMEEQCSPGLLEEEAQLRNMIDYYGDEWAEPMARLALILFTKRQYQDAAILCQRALEVKPWHFEVGKLLVAIELRQQQFELALKTARHYTLPELNSRTANKRRREWVQKWQSKAREVLEQDKLTATNMVQDKQLDDCPLVDGEDLCWG
jgi:tetratricopeptide (TPR) repeat protein